MRSRFPVAQVTSSQGELYSARCTSIEAHLLEATQATCRRIRFRGIREVQLRHCSASNRAGVSDGRANSSEGVPQLCITTWLNRGSRIRHSRNITCANLDLQARDVEGGVAQPTAELECYALIVRIKRFVVDQVALDEVCLPCIGVSGGGQLGAVD